MSKPAKPDAALGRHKIARALVELACSHVFHASIIMRLRREEWDAPFPMGTDGTALVVNPAMCSLFSVAELTAVLMHEAMHVAARHPLRCEWREKLPWNIAIDAVVNQLVKESCDGKQINGEPVKLPDGCVPPVADATPEQLYQKPPQSSKDFMQKLAGGSGQRFDDVFEPRHEDGRALSKAERQELEQETRQWVEAAASAAKRAGQLGAGLDRFVRRELRSVVHWKEILARFVSEKRACDYSWERPNKRYTSFDVYLPRLQALEVPAVAVAPDMSGSISPLMAEKVVAEVLAVLELMSDGATVEVPVLWFDHDVYPQVVSDTDELRPRGGGGTDYAPVMAWTTKEQPVHDFRGLVVVTDGYCASFGEAPLCDVLWVLTADHAEDFRPPFGEIALVLEEHR